jgi:hypothetical protein
MREQILLARLVRECAHDQRSRDDMNHEEAFFLSTRIYLQITILIRPVASFRVALTLGVISIIAITSYLLLRWFRREKLGQQTSSHLGN